MICIFDAREIGNEWADRSLAAKFEAFETPIAKKIPEALFRLSHVSPQSARIRIGHAQNIRH
jgi:hypothetical protein